MNGTSMELITTSLTSRHVDQLATGRETHEAALGLVNELLPHIQDETRIYRIVEASLAPGYSGNTLDEVPEMVRSGLAKGLHLRTATSVGGDDDLGPVALGCTNTGDYALFDPARQIVVLANSQQLLSMQFQLGLASTNYWRARYPVEKGRYDFMAAGEALMAQCKRLGGFDVTRLRGRGIWREGELIVQNLGQPLPDGLRHLYLCFQPLPIADEGVFPAERLRALLLMFPWRHPTDAMLFLGWLAGAPMCGGLEWRTHCFVYGPPNSGKSTLHDIATSLLTPLGLAADGQSTEAGIRQTLGPDSRPIIIDEFETDHKQSRLASVLRLARSASSARAPMLRGTVSGKALQYSLQTTIFFAAVNVTGMTPADESRILLLELVAHRSARDVDALIKSEMAFFDNLGPQWCGWMARNAANVLDGITVFKGVLDGTSSRHRLNIATLFSGAFAALNGRSPTVDEARAWATEYASAVSRHGLAHDRNDAQECFEHLLAHVVRSDGGQTQQLGSWLAAALKAQRNPARNAPVEAMLLAARYDLRIEHHDGGSGLSAGVYLKNGSPQLNAIFAGSRWENGAWRRSLGQLPSAFTPPDPVRFPSGKARALGLPLDALPPGNDLDPEF
jgi:hypothetical protein